MLNKIISRLSVQRANMLYKVFKVGFKFSNGQPKVFIEM